MVTCSRSSAFAMSEFWNELAFPAEAYGDIAGFRSFMDDVEWKDLRWTKRFINSEHFHLLGSSSFVPRRKSGKGQQSYPPHQHWNYGNPSSTFTAEAFDNSAMPPQFPNGNMAGRVETPSISFPPQHASGNYSNPLLWNVPRGPGSYGPNLIQNNHMASCPAPPPLRPMIPMPFSNMTSPPRMDPPQHCQPPGNYRLASSPQRGMNYYTASYRKSSSRPRGRRFLSPRVSHILARRNSANGPRLQHELSGPGKDSHSQFRPPAHRALLPFPDNAVNRSIPRGSNGHLAESTENSSRAFSNCGPAVVSSYSQDEAFRLMDASSDILSQVDVSTLLDSIKRLDAANPPAQQAPCSPVVKKEFDIPCITPRSPSPSPPPADNMELPENKVTEKEPNMSSSSDTVGKVKNSLPVDLLLKSATEFTEPIGPLTSAVLNISDEQKPQTVVIKSETMAFSGMGSNYLYSNPEAFYGSPKPSVPVSIYSTNVPVVSVTDSGCSVTLNTQASDNTVHSSHGLLGYRSMPPTDIRRNKLEDFDDYSGPRTPPADFSSFGDRSPDRKVLTFHEARAIPASCRGADVRRKVNIISRHSDWEACSDEESSPDRKREKRRKKEGRIDSTEIKMSKIDSKSTPKSSRSTRRTKGDLVLEKKKAKKSRESTSRKKNYVKSVIVKPDVDWMELHCSSDESDSNFPKMNIKQESNLFGDPSVMAAFAAAPTAKFDPEFVLESNTISRTSAAVEQHHGNFFGESLVVTLDDDFLEHSIGDIVADSEEILRARLVAAMDQETDSDEITANLPSEKKVLCVGQDGTMAWSNNSICFNFTSLLPPSSTDTGSSPNPEMVRVPAKKETVDRKSFKVTVDAESKEPEPASSSRASSTDRSQASNSSFFGRLISKSGDTITPEVFLRSNSPSASASLFPEPSMERKLFRQAKFEKPLPHSTKLIVPALRKKTVEAAQPIPVLSSSKAKVTVKPKKVKNEKGRKKAALKSVVTKSTKIKLPPLQRVSRLDKIAAQSEVDRSYPGSLPEPSDVIGRIQYLETELEESYWEDTEIAERIHSLEKSLRAACAQRSRVWMNLDDLRMKAERILHDNAGMEQTEVVEPMVAPSTDPFVRLTKQKRSPTPLTSEDREEVNVMDELICPNYIRVPPWNSAVVERPLCFDEDPLLCVLRDLKGKLTTRESQTKDSDVSFVDITDDNDAEILEGVDSVRFSEVDRHTFSYVSETLRVIGLQRYQNGFAGIGKRSPFSEAFLVEVDPQITYCFCGDEVNCIRYHIPSLSAEGRREKIQQELTKLIFDISDTADDLLEWKAAIDDLEERVQEDSSYESEAAQLWATLMEKLAVE